METFDPGDVIDGKYEILDRLGEGGMGFVVSARRRGLGSLVALKVLRPQFRDDPDLVARFAREAHAADLLRSEYVVRLNLIAKAAARTAAYAWQYSLDQKTWTAVPVTLQAKTGVPGLTAGSTYYFRVQAVTRTGAENWSQIVASIVK